MRPRFPRTFLPLAALCAGAALAPAGQRPQAWALKDVRLAPGEDAPRQTLVLRDGRIAEVLALDAPLPAELRVLEGHGLLALPAFVDACAFSACAPPRVEAQQDLPARADADLYVDMREANRKGIAPAHRAAEALTLDEEARKRWRSSGFSHLCAAPHGELLAGASALVCTRTLPSRDAIVRAELFQDASFDCSGPGYPGTLMGAIAQLRQFFLDARWSETLAQREREGRSGPRAPFDLDLEAILPALHGAQRVACEAESAADIERWLALADEFGFQPVIVGGREAWKRAELLARRKVPVLLTLEWGEEPEDPHAKPAAKPEGQPGAAPSGATQPEPKPDEAKPAESGAAPAATATGTDAKPAEAKTDKPRYELPLRVREDRRRRWEEARDGAQQLAAAGVEFAFGTGKAAPAELLDRVRTLVAQGLPRERALEALTRTPARLAALEKRLGLLQPGAEADLALWSADPLVEKDAKLAWLFVEGFAHEFKLDPGALSGKPEAGADAGGDWVFRFERPDAQPARAHLDMQSDGTLSGTLQVRLPGAQDEQSIALAGRLSGRKLHLEGKLPLGNFVLVLSLDGQLQGETLEGTSRWKGSEHVDSLPFSATRKPKRAAGGAEDDR